MKIFEILGEAASGGSTGAGAIASVASPMGSILKRPSIFGYTAPAPKKKKKKKKTTENLKSIKTLPPQQLAKKHQVSMRQIMYELERGIRIEQEHTTDKKAAREIALDHLAERPDYYTMLIKAEKSPIKESMDFNAGKLDKDRLEGYPEGVWSGVLGKELYYDFSKPPWNDPKYGGGPNQDEPPFNPRYAPEENMNVSNHSADLIAQELGFSDADFHMEINEFLAYATQWLRQHIGKQTREEPVEVDRRPDRATMVTGGRREGYFNEAIMRMVKLARLGKERGATHVWFA